MAKSERDEFFNIRWGKDSPADKKVDRRSFETLESAGNQLQNVSEAILGSFKNGCASTTRINWMNGLTKDALSFIAHQRGMRLRAVEEEAGRYQASKNLLEQIFDLLQLYAYDFNTSAVWTSLQVTCTRPAFVSEVLRYNKLREPIDTITTFRARISTRFLSLVIVGRKDSIEFRLLPVEEVIGLSRAEAAYDPFLTIESKEEDGEIMWLVANHELTAAGIETICMELFSILIEQTKLEATRNGTF